MLCIGFSNFVFTSIKYTIKQISFSKNYLSQAISIFKIFLTDFSLNQQATMDFKI